MTSSTTATAAPTTAAQAVRNVQQVCAKAGGIYYVLGGANIFACTHMPQPLPASQVRELTYDCFIVLPNYGVYQQNAEDTSPYVYDASCEDYRQL